MSPLPGDEFRGVPELTDALRAFKQPTPAGTPDLAARILGRVEQQRPFVSRRGRWLVGAFRACAVLAVAGLLGGIVYAQTRPVAARLSPLAGRPQPVTDLVRTAAADAERAATMGGLLAAREPVPDRLSPAAEAAALRRGESSRRGPVVMTVALPARSVERPGEAAGGFAAELSQSLSERGTVGPR